MTTTPEPKDPWQEAGERDGVDYVRLGMSKGQPLPRQVLASEELESEVLTALLNSHTLVEKYAALLAPTDFDHPHTRAVFGAIQSLAHSAKSASRALVLDELRRTGDIERLKSKRGDAYLDDLEAAPVIVDLDEHVRLLREKSARRRLAQTTIELRATLLRGDDPHASAELFSSRLATIASGEEAPPPTAFPLPPLAADAAAADWARPLPPSIPTGLADLDRAIEGFFAEGAYALVGPTGRGKTGLALQMARAVAAQQPVVYFSSELSRRQVLARAAAPLLRRAWSNLYRLGPAESQVIVDALQGLRLRVVEIGRDTALVDAIAAVADAEGRAPFVVLDYLQHAARRLMPDDMRLATAALMDQMTEWARASRSTALVLSATGRGFHGGNENRQATDFVTAGKESGDVEYDAAGVFFLDCDPCPPGGVSAARLHVAKSRFQGTGATIGLRFDGALGSFACDPSSALSDEQRAALEAIEAGAESVEELRKKLGVRKTDATQLVKLLHAQRLIERNPLKVVPRLVTP